MNIRNATIITTLHNVLTDLKIRHLGGDLFVEATMPPHMVGDNLPAPTFLLFDMERHFAVCLYETLDFDTRMNPQPGVMFSPIIFAELKGTNYLSTERNLRLKHGEHREISLLIAYWFLRAKSGMGKEKTLQFLKTTYSDVAPVQWGNYAEAMEDMERFLKDLKEPVAA
jgi:hypothetical protein